MDVEGFLQHSPKVLLDLRFADDVPSFDHNIGQGVVFVR